jgi:hypothetical protein
MPIRGATSLLTGSFCWTAIAACPARPASAARQFDLEGIVLVTPGATERHVRRIRESGSIGGLPAQHCFGRRITPRLVRNAAERQTGLFDRGSFELQRRRDRDEGERIGEAIANFQVGVI